MKRIAAIIFLLQFFLNPAYAKHIRGGEMYYKYISTSPSGMSTYQITLKLYIACDATEPQLDDSEPFTIYNKKNNGIVGDPVYAPFITENYITYDPASNPCIQNAPTDICYRMRFYSLTLQLPDNAEGYTIAFQRCCRIAGIENLVPPSSNDGVTYLCEIPGSNALPLPEHNSSPVISGNDAVAICTNSYFSYDFSAIDPDGDSLLYSLCDAYNGASPDAPGPAIATPPPYIPLTYQFPYSGGSPLGLKASIDPHTGLITGIAPDVSSQYVVTVCIAEFRHGKIINIHRKDIHLRIADCIPLKAALQPDYSYCNDFLTSFLNGQSNPAGSLYIWQFGDGSGPDTSSDPMGAVQHQYLDTGSYKVRLKVVLAGKCVDSTTTIANVFPGFYPGFINLNSCFLHPVQFQDTTKTTFGFVSSWRWDFGDQSTLADTSHSPTPSWKYPSAGTRTVALIVQSNKGCLDTVYRDIQIKDKPQLVLPFRDTLICDIDSLQLHAIGLGVFTWSPGVNILNAGTPDPVVFPKTTTQYYVNLNDGGCINNDSVRVRVVDFVTLGAGPDSTICLTDPAFLHAAGDGLAFSWTPAAGLDNPNSRNPIAHPVATTTYQVLAHIGKCSASSQVTIHTVPYPGAHAGADTSICYQDTIQLHGSIQGSSFSWSPSYGLNSPALLEPLAFPLQTTSYVLTVYDNLGCPKPGLDTVLVTVRPPVAANAGPDTAVVVGQPLKLHASGGDFYLWTPPDFLNNNQISSPVAIFTAKGEYLYSVRVTRVDNCFATDTIRIRVFQTAPDIFVPNAFTPGENGNRVFKPIPVGISKIDFFRIYNRWGQLVYSASEEGIGWNGKLNGKDQVPDTYVWVVQGHDYTGKVIFKKGTMVLVR